ncbi:DUF1427 family protein [Phenylobacterium deserti]|uniref:XapX domain-containing protein n=1 Tax=Phenylobacterium deserti TaxID=1914756 RepID=A0A328ADZ2_9CAUL|nr:DUF1427 family protein [Phenylobacterium deserti]RAK52707.1 XapX domain-containing protein [Phenylobacterium deserti]
MKPYLIALAMGLAAGLLYGAFQVRSPAPPVIALVGLFGMLVGEQVPARIRQLVARPAGLAETRTDADRDIRRVPLSPRPPPQPGADG